MLETSNNLKQDGKNYRCRCKLESNDKGFHYCPATNKFVPSDFCNQHIECNDPINVGFGIAEKCYKFSDCVTGFQDDYKEISQSAIRFCVDILDQCCSMEEVKVLLGEQSRLTKIYSANILYNDDRFGRVKYPRIHAAINEKNKEFVSHTYCQQILQQEWYGGANWQGTSFLYKVCLLSPYQTNNYKI